MPTSLDPIKDLSQNTEFLMKGRAAADWYLIQATSGHPIDEVCLLPFLFALLPADFNDASFSNDLKELFIASVEKYLGSFTANKAIFGAMFCERLSMLLVALVGSEFLLEFGTETYLGIIPMCLG